VPVAPSVTDFSFYYAFGITTLSKLFLAERMLRFNLQTRFDVMSGRVEIWIAFVNDLLTTQKFVALKITVFTALANSSYPAAFKN
jgi:hypothetical protein